MADARLNGDGKNEAAGPRGRVEGQAGDQTNDCQGLKRMILFYNGVKWVCESKRTENPTLRIKMNWWLTAELREGGDRIL